MVDLSYSKVANFLACPAKLKYELSAEKYAKSAALAYGSAWHDILNRHFKDEVFTIEEVVRSHFNGVPGELDKNWNGQIAFGEKDWPIETMISWFGDAFELMKQRNLKPELTELRLERQFPTFNLRGIIDAFNQGVLVDFKLAGGTYNKERGKKVYEADSLQMAVYAIIQGGAVPADFVVMFKEKTPRIDIIPVPEAENQKYLDFVVSDILTPVAAAIESGIFPANPGWKYCDPRWCGWWSQCRGRAL